jgi:hypothetical protein
MSTNELQIALMGRMGYQHVRQIKLFSLNPDSCEVLVWLVLVIMKNIGGYLLGWAFINLFITGPIK